MAAHARRVANFMNSLGAGWDLFFYDPLDRDAGYYEFQWNDGGARWWDESDNPTRFPNFVRIRQWLAYLSQYQGKRCMLWQVPVGNYYYATCNNTPGHYEDNRAQYFLEGYPTNPHLRQWADAGVIGILFGRGAGEQSTYSDSERDGTTNPTRYINDGTRRSPTNLGHPAAYPDDDGGYLRLKVRAYHTAGALSLPGAAPVPSPSGAPVISGVSATMGSPTTATVTWITDQTADSRVEYGTTTAYGSSAAGASSAATHSVLLSGLTPGTTYQYRVRSRNAAGLESVSANRSFSTPVAPNFVLTLSPTTRTVRRGKAGTISVSLAGQGGFAGSVGLTAAVSPALVGSVALSGTSLAPGQSTALAIRVGRRALPGSYTITVTGIGGGLTRTSTAIVVVQ